MSIGRLLGILVLIVVLYAIIARPLDAAQTTRNGASHLADWGTSITVFLSSLVGGAHDWRVHYTPAGGVAAGDGSTAR